MTTNNRASRIEKQELLNAKITRIYWLNEEGEESDDLSEIEEGEVVTLLLDVEDAIAGQSIRIELSAPEEERFLMNKEKIILFAFVKEINGKLKAVVEDFSFRFESSKNNNNPKTHRL